VRTETARKLASADVEQLSRDLGVGQLLLRDILVSLARPGRDPREDLPPPIFRREVLKLEDLKPGMELSGTILNVVDFGAFVDIGLIDSGLIHVSRLADRFVSDPHDVVSVGDILRVWVVEVDVRRRRVSLTAIPPGTPRIRPERRPQKPAESTADKASQRGQVQRGAQPRPPRPARRATRDKPKPRRAAQKPRPQTKPVVPLTEAMEEGREPMRTFSDLKQFYEKRKTDQQAPGESGRRSSEET
jgi:uncharacterized protein